MEGITITQGLRRGMLAIGGVVLTCAALFSMLLVGPPGAGAAPSATVSGQVTHTSGAPLGSVCVTLYDVDDGGGWTWIAGTTTRPDGSYEVAVDPGIYLIRFEDCGSGYDVVGMSYGDRGAAEPPQTKVPAEGLSGVDAVLPTGRRISGTVTDTSGLPAAGVCVVIHPYDSVRSNDWRSVGWAVADEVTGAWTANALPPGDYVVQYVNCGSDGSYIENGRWVPEMHSDVYPDDDDPDLSALRPVTIEPDADPKPITDDLLRAAHLKGIVTGDGTPASDVCLAGPGTRGVERTDGGGAWYATVRPGTHTFVFTDCKQGRGLAQEVITVPVAEGASLIHDVAMTTRRTASVSGRVTNRNGVPVERACVVAFVPDQMIGVAEADSSGAWSITGLGAGSYILALFNCEDPMAPMIDSVDGTKYPTTWWPAAPADLSGPPDPIRDGAKAVHLAPGDVATGYDFCLPVACASRKPPVAPRPVTNGPGPAIPTPAPEQMPVGAVSPGTPPSAPGSVDRIVTERVLHAGSWPVGSPTFGASDGATRSDSTSPPLGEPVTASAAPAVSGERWWKALAAASALSSGALWVGLVRTRRRLVSSDA